MRIRKAMPTPAVRERAASHSASERFGLKYLPAEAATFMKEALACYSADCHNAFASMCRRTAASVILSLGPGGKLKLFDQFKESIRLAEIDMETEQILENILFAEGHLANLPAASAAILVEVLRDMLVQLYTRPAQLRAAIQIRRYFATEAADNVTPFKPLG